MYKTPLGKYRGMKMSHLMADSTEELLDFVDKIGVLKKWIQHKDTKMEHFDIALSKRTMAIKQGAVEVTMRELAIAAVKRKDNNSKLIIKDESNNQTEA